MGLLGRDGARLRRRVGSTQVAALRVLRRNGFRHARRQERRLLRPLSPAAWKRCASRIRIMKQCIEKLRAPEGQGPVSVLDNKVVPPQARRDEALDGSADPSLQALHRRLPRSGRRSLRRASKRPRASSASISSPTAPTSPTSARSARPASRICSRWIFSAAAISWPTSPLCSAPSISCSERWIDDPPSLRTHILIGLAYVRSSSCPEGSSARELRVQRGRISPGPRS